MYIDQLRYNYKIDIKPRGRNKDKYLGAKLEEKGK
jgi:hypothetical protein